MLSLMSKIRHYFVSHHPVLILLGFCVFILFSSPSHAAPIDADHLIGLVDQGEYEKASSLLESKAEDIFIGPEYYYLLGYLKNRQGQYEEALSALLKARREYGYYTSQIQRQQ